jgi:cell division septation protein DedD
VEGAVSEQEPSYYEIALTNRQVLVAFVILLVCVMAAFFAGIWVGRGSPAAATDGPQEAVAEPTPTGQPEELAFFNDGESGTSTATDRPDLQELARNPRQGTTLAEDLGVKDAPRAGSSPAPVAPGGEPEVPPGPGGEPSAPPAATGTAAPAAAPAGALFIQVFSSRDELQARRLETRMRAAGFKAFLSPAGPMFRVRIGPFTARAEADTVAAKARREFRVDTWITASP